MTNKNNARRIDGILLINKPAGLTSNAVLQRTKRVFRAKKAGHTGSLDPMATGMLPICFGEATKFCQYLLDADKCYDVTGRLGIKTNTGDATGEVVLVNDAFTITEAMLRTTLSQFVGPIKQVPSMFSALKHQGQPLYKYARAGIDIERPPRDIMIHELILTAFDGEALTLSVTCSKGTYIRNLIEDIGERLGLGAHVTRLHRLYTAGFSDKPMLTLEALEGQSDAWLDAQLLPMDLAVNHLPRLALPSEVVQQLQQGKVVNDWPMTDGIGSVRLYEEGIDFVGLGELDANGFLKAKRLLGR